MAKFLLTHCTSILLSILFHISTAVSIFSADDSSTAASIERRLHAVYEKISPAIVKVMVHDNEHVLAEGAIVSPEGHVLMRPTPELLQHFHGNQPLLFVLSDGRQLHGKPLGWSEAWRIALAQITDEGPFLDVEIAPKTDLNPGQPCIAFEFSRIGAQSEGVRGNRRELKPNMQLGCVSNVASGKWFHHSCLVDQYPTVFDLEGRLIGVTTVKPIFEDPRCTSADVIRHHWDDLAAGKNVDRERLATQADAEPDSRRNQPSATDEKPNGQAIPAAVESAARATVRIRPAGQRDRGWSGVIISPDGLVATCAHHKRLPGEQLGVLLPDGRDLKAKSLGMNPVLDIGFVKIIEVALLPHVDLGDSSKMRDGDPCWLAGFPVRHQDRQPLLRRTHVEDQEDRPWSSTLYTSKTSDYRGGDSGGGVFNANGELIAILQGKNPDDYGRQQRVELLRAEWDFLTAGAAIQTTGDEPLHNIV